MVRHDHLTRAEQVLQTYRSGLAQRHVLVALTTAVTALREEISTEEAALEGWQMKLTQHQYLLATYMSERTHLQSLLSSSCSSNNNNANTNAITTNTTLDNEDMPLSTKIAVITCQITQYEADYQCLTTVTLPRVLKQIERYRQYLREVDDDDDDDTNDNLLRVMEAQYKELCQVFLIIIIILFVFVIYINISLSATITISIYL